jgi:hypothetical protein
MKKLAYQFSFILLFFLMGGTSVNAQILLKEVSLKRQIENSSLVVEGKVLSKKSFWDAENKNIYTANSIEVYKVFKGEFISIIEVITPGGTVGYQAQMVVPSLNLREGDIGVLTLYDNNTSISDKNKSNKKQFKVYSSLQGFYKYNLYDNAIVNPFHSKKGIAKSFYDEIMNYTGLNYIEVSSFNVEDIITKLIQNKSVLAPSAIDFSPTTVTAGTKSTITITIPSGGTGDFGSTQGKVSFSNGDSGGLVMGNIDYIDALDSQVVWSTNSITVEVPSEAGTGKIKVTDFGGAIITSSIDLTVPYSIINHVNAGNAYIPQHFNENLTGGYTWQMYTGFDSKTNAKNSFMRAFNNWICTTGINWKMGTPTSVNEIAIDNVNVIRFDNSVSPLPEGTLGRCSYVFGTCDNLQWLVTEFDIVFDDDVNSPDTPGTEAWNFSTNDPLLNEFDFESVALHELGHGHMLGHVINSSVVMNYNLSISEFNRVLSLDDINAGLFVQNRSTSTVFCGQPLMANLACPLSVEDEELKDAISIYPNPSKGSFNIKNRSLINLEKVVIYDISGRLISEYNMTNSSRIKTINLVGVSKGMYFINIQSERGIITKKLVLE